MNDKAMEKDADGQYRPKPGSKIDIAIQALADGPLHCVALGQVMRSAPGNVMQMLKHPLESDLLVKVQDESGLLHFALSDMRLGPEFKKYIGRQSPDTSDPFGALARRQTEKSNQAPPLHTSQRSVAETAMSEHVNRTRNAVTTDPFEIAVFSSGAMSITVGNKSVRLDPDQQKQLREFMARCGLSPAR